MGQAVGKEPCPKCGSRDNLVRYADGGAHCFSVSCDYFERATGGGAGVKEEAERDWTPVRGEVLALPKRGIKEEICKLYHYEVVEFNGQPVQIANFFNNERQLVRH